MAQERLERSVGTFWRETCGIDNGWRNAHLADTPWTGFTPEKTLVVTLWQDEIVDIFDPEAGHTRRFVRIGDLNTKWNSTLKTKGAAAVANIRTAFSEQRKFCGYEIKPHQRQSPRSGQKKVAPTIEHFYMDRYHRLQWLPARRPDHERLKISQEFTKRGMEPPPNLAGNEPGHYFELVQWEGPAPHHNPPQVAIPGQIRPIQALASQLGTPANPPPGADDPPADPPWFSGWGGGESEHHKALKAYVAAHPSKFGAPVDAEAIIEFGIWSGDCIDVVFQTPKDWVAVEVKSAISGFEDCRRGIFQTIKYRAVLKAQAKCERRDDPRQVRVLLVLEGQLPAELRDIAKQFDCDVRESVKPKVLPPLPQAGPEISRPGLDLNPAPGPA